MGSVIADVRYAWRMMRRAPGITVAAVVSLALGIGANTTIFGWTRAILLEPFPGVADQRSLIALGSVNAAGEPQGLSYPDYRELRDSAASLDSLFAQDVDFVSLGATTPGTRAERLLGTLVTGNYFHVLGIQAQRGRMLTPDDDRVPDASPVAVISHGLWQRRFGGRADVVGSSISLNGRPFTVVGIAPEPFEGTIGGLRVDVWVPTVMTTTIKAQDRLEARGIRWLQGFGRLKPGVTFEQSQAELDTIARRLAAAYPRTNEGQGARLYALTQTPWGAQFVMRPVLIVLSAMVGLILTIACVNVANLLLGRALGRRREIAMRLSIGASRRRLMRQILTESTVLGLVAGIASLAVAAASLDVLRTWLPPIDIPIRVGLRLDWTLVTFAVALSAAVGLLFGLAPAWRLSRTDLVESLKEESGASGGASRSRARGALVVVQVMLSLVLLVAAGLFFRSLQRAATVSPGFNPAHVAIASYDLFQNGYTAESGAIFHTTLLDRVQRLPGVRSASLASYVPLGLTGASTWRLRVDGYVPARGETMDILTNFVSADYFRTMEIPIVEGRAFTIDDRPIPDDASAMRVVIVNETMARRYWRGRSAIGGIVRTNDSALQVVGVARDGKYQSLGEPSKPAVYFALSQRYRPAMTLHVRAASDPSAILQAVRETTASLDPNLPLFDVKTMTVHMGFATFPQRIASSFLGASGVLALLLAGIGLYSVMAYSVAQRRREMGIRMALGARPGDMLRLVIRQALILVVVGLVLGAAVAWPLARVLARTGLLVGVQASDPVTLTLVTLLLAMVGAAASLVPALRASRIDPIAALKTGV